MAVQTARFGVLATVEFLAAAGRIQEADFVADITMSATFPARLSRTASFTVDVGAQVPTTTPFPGFFLYDSDPVGVFSPLVGAQPTALGNLFTVLEFDAGPEGSGSGGGSSIANGFELLLGAASLGDGSFDGAVVLTEDTPVSSAIDLLNEVLGLLVPSPPPEFPGSAVPITSVGTTPLLATGVTDNGSIGTFAGSSVTRITGNLTSGTIQDRGPGKSGTLTGLLNGVAFGSRDLTGDDEGNYNGLVISDQTDYPAESPGFWKTIDVSISNLIVPVGLNGVEITHSAANSTSVRSFVRDDFTASPTLSGLGLTLSDAGTLAYSSGVGHFNTGAVFTVSGNLGNNAGKTYYGGSDALQVSSTGSILSNQNFSLSGLGISVPMAADDQADKAFSEEVTLDGNVHASGKLRARGRNVNGTSTVTDLGGPTLLVMRGAGSGRFVEANVTVSNLGAGSNAVRVSAGAGDTPAAAVSTWDSSAALADHEAACVAGVLAHDETDYSSGYLPVGPDLSSDRDGAQYATFSFARSARSGFDISINGTYAGLWVRLPGVSDQGGISPNASGGWWDMFQAYDGAGVPGETGDPNAGCADGAVATGNSGTFACTFGTQSSTNATDNEIQVRVKLDPGQSINSLSFTG